MNRRIALLGAFAIVALMAIGGALAGPADAWTHCDAVSPSTTEADCPKPSTTVPSTVPTSPPTTQAMCWWWKTNGNVPCKDLHPCPGAVSNGAYLDNDKSTCASLPTYPPTTVAAPDAPTTARCRPAPGDNDQFCQVRDAITVPDTTVPPPASSEAPDSPPAPSSSLAPAVPASIPSSPARPTSLPATGAASDALILLAGCIIGAGIALTIAAMRRRGQ